MAEERRTFAGALAAVWALAGVILLFLYAVFRLGRRGLETVHAGLDAGEWAALALLTVVFLYGEGVRALQRRWVPRLVQRAGTLRREGGFLYRVLAPLYGMALVGGPARRTAVAWATTTGIVAAVLLVRAFPEPWRGITDLAVASALLWGVGAIVATGGRAFD